MKSDLDELFAKLHEELTNELLERLRSGDATTADLNAARQLLRDNGIDVNTNREATPLLDLAGMLPFQSDDEDEIKHG